MFHRERDMTRGKGLARASSPSLRGKTNGTESTSRASGPRHRGRPGTKGGARTRCAGPQRPTRGGRAGGGT